MWHRIFTSRQVGEHTCLCRNPSFFFFSFFSCRFHQLVFCACLYLLSLPICFSSKFYCTMYIRVPFKHRIYTSISRIQLNCLPWIRCRLIYHLHTLQRKNKEILTFTYTCGRCAYCHPIIASPLLCFTHLLEFQNSAHPDTRKKKEPTHLYLLTKKNERNRCKRKLRRKN